jgi:arginyl-tRNA--protein-N-Asp/Glu arginylyltransferase
MLDLFYSDFGSRFSNMAEYLHFDRKTITDFSDKNIESLYNQGYVFGRRGKGIMDQTRSMRIDLSKFEMSSENRRIMRKTENIIMNVLDIPFAQYSWEIGKLAKDFYDTKFGAGTFSANKVKEILTDTDKSNFDALMVFYSKQTPEGPVTCIAFGDNPPVETPLTFPNPMPDGSDPMGIGYAICYEVNDILHYSYPFYDLENVPKEMGMGMMLRAILWAKAHEKTHIYLGSAQRPGDTYKLQFKGLEWFDGSGWSENLDALKEILQ